MVDLSVVYEPLCVEYYPPEEFCQDYLFKIKYLQTFKYELEAFMDPFTPHPKTLPLGPYLALDYGKKVVGIAYFHPSEDNQAMPFERILYINDKQVISDLNIIIKKEKIENIVIGLPYYPDGNPSKMSERVVQFSRLLRQGFPELNLFEQDESGTSKEAKELMESSALHNFSIDLKKIDQISASLILNRFIKSFLAKSS